MSGEPVNAISQVVRVQFPNIGEFDFAVHRATDQFISNDLMKQGVWEPFESTIFARICIPGDTVLDIGANIGWYSVLACRILGLNGRVVAFEPEETNYQLLKANVATADTHSIVKTFQLAVGDRAGQTLLYKSASNLGDHRIFCDGTSREATSIQMTTLNDFFDGAETLPDVVKSDTQGAEGRILKGASRLLRQGWRPILLIEYWPFGLSLSGNDPLSLWQELSALDYQIYQIVEESQKLHLFTEQSVQNRLLAEISPSSQGFVNLLCIPSTSARMSLVRSLIAKTDIGNQ